MDDDRYFILFAQLRFVWGLFGHNFLVLRDARGRVLRELNGLATGADGKMKPVGYLPSDTLRVYEDQGARYYHSRLPQIVVAEGSYADIAVKWAALQACAAALNAKRLRYPCLGLGCNSNSIASTMLAALNVAEPMLHKSAFFSPGKRRLLLDKGILNALSEQALSETFDGEPEHH